MIADIQLKVCGLTSVADAALAVGVGADHLGFIFHPASPRGITLSAYAAMAPRLPNARKVAVTVEPSRGELESLRDAGLDFFQIHFGAATTDARLAEWSDVVGAERLWLAPKLPPGSDVSPATLAAARFVLFDTFHAGGFGGSGRTGDWPKFARHQAAHPDHVWILAGGLNADNIGAALAQSGARLVDVSSGVESAPGKKDAAKLQAFAAALRHAREANS